MRGNERTVRVVHGTRVVYLIRRLFDFGNRPTNDPHAVRLCHSGKGGDAFGFRGVFCEGGGGCGEGGRDGFGVGAEGGDGVGRVEDFLDSRE